MHTDLGKTVQQAVKDQEAIEKAIERKEFFKRAWIKKISDGRYSPLE